MSNADKSSEVSIIGGGFAGLAAAQRLLHAGVKFRIFEKRPFFGGRAYSFQESKTGETVDNGQHLMMGAYHETLQFFKELGTDSLLHQQDNLEITFAQSNDNFFSMSCPKLPAPLHLAWGLYKFKGLSWQDKVAMNRLVKFCKKTKDNDISLHKQSVEDLFKKTQQTPQSIRVFWEPVGLATLNEPMEQASAALFVEVIKRALLSKRKDSQIITPQVGFNELYCDPLKEKLLQADVPLHFQTQVEEIKKSGSSWLIRTHEGEEYLSEKIIFAIPPPALKKILKNSETKLKDKLNYMDQIQAAPIVSINLWYENFNPPQSFVGFINSPIHWLFNKSKIYPNKKANYISLVISGAYSLAVMEKNTLVQLAEQELKRFYPEIESHRLLHSQVIKEYWATFGARPGEHQYRPHCKQDIEGIYFAGDWTNTGLPSTIESAVLSGHRAVDYILKESA
ncbi:MAG: FAD-dependent oxidoreductase [Deltaproteobacteria bacterium]|nr:FAD-dependent oxidoreductase [Deltaproteobacteria bacterium]